MNQTILQAAEQQLKIARQILIASHKRPDGDAVGSLLGLGLALRAAGKDVQMVLSDGVPKSFRHLSGSDQVRSQPEGQFDLIIVVDCSDLQRVGTALNGYSKPDINIDHHVTNLNFAKINMVEIEAVATSEILAELLVTWDLPISHDIAAALLTGLITDTLGFRTANMTPRVLRVAADLMDTGVDLSTMYFQAMGRRSFQAAKYWGPGLSSLQRDGELIWATLSLADRRFANYSGRDDADLINIISSLDKTSIAMIFVEQTNGRVKVSWRARPGFDVSQVAIHFGGGGHKPAAGAEINGDLKTVKENVINLTRSLLEKEPTDI